ncbi:hypothetical protein KR044_011062 [Drosophila immigrans]|nr:hypothetical protein KR044_011062 [Drosophila immigrans]
MFMCNFQNYEEKPEEDVELEEQFIIRFPADIAKNVRDGIEVGDVSKTLSIYLDTEHRNAIISANGEILHGKLMELPTLIESYKTTDNVNLYKTANIHEILICSRLDNDSELEGTAEMEHLDEESTLPHGLTPPTRNIRKRYRRRLKKKTKNSKQSKQETLQTVRQLIREDVAALLSDFVLCYSDVEEIEDEFGFNDLDDNY